MDKLLSIVVASYNAEKYLADNLTSFDLPSLRDKIEVLIVNDGSTDRTREIALSFVQRAPETFRLIDKENGGHGSCINTGIREAHGRYFKVVDADDWVSRNGIEALVAALETAESDIVFSDFLWAFDDGSGSISHFPTKSEGKARPDAVQDGRTYSFASMPETLYIKMHNLTIRTELLQQHTIRLDEHCYYVDTEYILYPIPYVKTISFVDAVVYYYRIGRTGQSVGLEKMQRNRANYDRVMASLLAFYAALGNRIPCDSANRRYIERILARIAASKVKILLSFPPSADGKRQLVAFERELQQSCPAVFAANQSRPVALLRASHYLLYYPASLAVRGGLGRK